MPTLSKNKTSPLYGRQVAFICAFLLPCTKLLEVPSLLARYAKGDILLPALLHFLLQAAILLLLLYVVFSNEKTIEERLREKFGRGVIVFYLLYAVYFLFYAILPLLDLEKFTYAAFSDTEPSLFSFAFFFFVSAYLCSKHLRSIGRFADLCLFLFLIPFLALLVMSFTETDFSGLLPLFGTGFGDTMYAFYYTTPHFSDVALLLPLLIRLKPQKGDGVKIMTGYGVGAALSLLFFAVFFGIFSTIAPREHYAFSKIAQYFPALSVVGRIDLLFIYLVSVVLLVCTSLPLFYTTELLCDIFQTQRRVGVAFALNFLIFIGVLFANRHYNFFYSLISGNLPWVFWLVADLLPLFLLFLRKPKPQKSTLKEARNA